MDVLGWFASVFGAFNDFLGSVLLWTLNLVDAVDPIVRILLAFVGIFLETTLLVGLLIPGDTIVIVASTAVTTPWQYVATLLAVVLGALAGESVGFVLGRWVGHRIRASKLGKWLGEKNWVRAENYVDRRGGIAVFVSRFLPVLHSLVPITVGMSTMRYARFIRWTAPACLIWALGYVTFGTLAAGGYRALSTQLHFAGYLFVAAVALFAVVAFMIKKLLERSEARHWDHPGDGDANTMED